MMQSPQLARSAAVSRDTAQRRQRVPPRTGSLLQHEPQHDPSRWRHGSSPAHTTQGEGRTIPRAPRPTIDRSRPIRGMSES